MALFGMAYPCGRGVAGCGRCDVSRSRRAGSLVGMVLKSVSTCYLVPSR